MTVSKQYVELGRAVKRSDGKSVVNKEYDS